MLFAGFSHFAQLRKMIQMAAAHKVPAPTFAVLGTGLLLAFGGLSFITWYEIWWGTVLLLVFFIPVTLIMHAFWKEQEPEKRIQNMHTFMGNVSIIGLLLIVLNFVH